MIFLDIIGLTRLYFYRSVSYVLELFWIKYRIYNLIATKLDLESTYNAQRILIQVEETDFYRTKVLIEKQCLKCQVIN